MLVLQIKFDDRAVVLIYTICHIATHMLTFVGSLTCCKEAKTMGMIHDKRYFQNDFPSFFSIIFCWYTFEFQHVPTT